MRKHSLLLLIIEAIFSHQLRGMPSTVLELEELKVIAWSGVRNTYVACGL